MGFTSFLFLISILCILSFVEPNSDLNPQQNNLQTYIVHVEPKPENQDSWYSSFLPKNVATSDEEPEILHEYRHVTSGFAAKLSSNHVKLMQDMDGFVSARPERVFSLHTTHSPSFLGLHENFGFWNGSNYGKGVIIGLLDTGIFPTHPSFSDEGMPPPPAKWKGTCEFNFTACNNKLIGARSFINGDVSPQDDEGHGTHTSSTAAGNFVKGANIFGNANGTAVGMAPLAHLAMYRVCSEFGCAESAILAAMDAAIDDGVDVLSLSLGGPAFPFYEDSIALGAYSAIQKGIFVSCSAGNSGPFNQSLSNEAPWILTVGASTLDRKIKATAVLGNNQEIDGQSAYQPKDIVSTMLPLFFPVGDPFCRSLNETQVKGKIVLCEVGGGIGRVAKGILVKNAGGAGMILMNPELFGYTTMAEAHVLPAIHISYADGLNILSYVNSTSNPTATIVFKGTIIGGAVVGQEQAPVVAGFSSRGPSVTSPGILKPDIIGPGVSILAAWPVSVENNTDTKSTFNMISGTSMSCPHLSGVAALLKSAHPDWSPATIKSAIVTTADTVNLRGKPIEDQRLLPADIFSIGAGHVNPSRANDPGLVYDIQPDDYIPYLCGLNYTDREVGVIVQGKVDCAQESSIPEAQLNYPSFSIVLGSTSQTYSRTVTNVGEASSSYNVEIVSPDGVSVSVEPTKLSFSQVNQKLVYNVTFSPSGTGMKNVFSQGYIKWNSGTRYVRSPIAVLFE